MHVRTVVIKRDGEREREEKEQSTCCGSWLSLRRIPFSAAMIRLQSPSLPLCLSLYYTLTLFSLILKYTHFNHSLTRSPRRGLTPVCARVSLRSPWRPFPGWFTIAPGPSQGGTLVCSPPSLPGHQWSHPFAPLTLPPPPPRLSSWTWFTPVFCPLAAHHIPLSVTVYPP